MPINLRYGQQAVARGFLNAQRLQQVLAKQRQLAEQGKKVSVRMILEKAKLLDRDQLSQIDRDLNIKVVKKHTTRVQKPGVQQPAQPMGAQNFAGEQVPQFSGMQGADPDATVFSPPPPDMQEKVRAERERAKEEARRKQEAEAANFFGDDNASPFGGDPFGVGTMVRNYNGTTDAMAAAHATLARRPTPPGPIRRGHSTPRSRRARGGLSRRCDPLGADQFLADLQRKVTTLGRGQRLR